MSDSSFPVSLIFPPQGHFTQPYLALPCLQAYLKQNGFEDVQLIDASVESYDHFLSEKYVHWAAKRAAEILPIEGFETRPSLGFDDLEAFRAAAESSVAAEAVAERIEAAKSVIRGQDFYDPDKYLPAVRTLYHALRVVSAAHFPSRLTPHNFQMAYATDRSSEILEATLDREQNPYLAYFEQELLPRLVQRAPRVLGLSVIYGSQLIPALTLARMVKRALPDCHITAGGGFLAYIGKKLMQAQTDAGSDQMRSAFADCIDSIIFHEGEQPLLELSRALKAGQALDSIGSLAWFDRSRTGSPAVFNDSGHPIRLDTAPAPDFGGLPLAKYFSPELCIPYDINRGCYYGECTFCTLPTVIGPGYRTRQADTIAEHVVQLRDQMGTRNFNFITDCMPPGMIGDLPRELIEREADVRWWADARVEPGAYDPKGVELLYQSGCRKLLFGFETATPRLLKMMKKGQSHRTTIEVAENCTKAGISVTFYAMVGFPSETREEARDSLNFIIQHRDVVREVSLQTFHLDEVAQTYKEPEAFGLEILEDEKADLQLYHDFRSESGMTRSEAAEMFEEMMSAFRKHLTLFSGDHIYYFMQKSHYFLHLARDEHPDDFQARCQKRNLLRSERGARGDLVTVKGLEQRALPYSYTEVTRRLASPLARAVSPDFLTGRSVESVRDKAEADLGGLTANACILAYAPEQAEFLEISADGASVLNAIEQAGSLAPLLESVEDQPEAARRLEQFAARMHGLGALTPSSTAHAPAPMEMAAKL